MKRVSAPERTRERLRALMDGRLGTAPDRSNLVLLAAQLIVEEALEAEVRDEVGRERYKRAEGDANRGQAAARADAPAYDAPRREGRPGCSAALTRGVLARRGHPVHPRMAAIKKSTKTMASTRPILKTCITCFSWHTSDPR